uniref:Uncharacterized protein n=1 Tax=Panagrolaimus davidi TaxID=227884 RepID=A0A914QQD5_9BILA
MSEYYQISHLKELCDKYLSKIELDLSSILEVLEICNKYSLIKAKEAITNFIFQNFTILKSNEFLKANKLVIKEIVTVFATKQQSNKYLENLFICVYKWSKNQANIKKQQLSNNETLNMNDAIKAEMLEFLPFIEFKKMGSSFLRKFVVQKGFLFTDDEFADILEYSKSYFKVKITNNLGQSIFGVLSKENKDTMEFIKTISHSESVNYYNFYIFWNLKRRLPSTPSLLKKRDGVSWYLIYFCDGYIGVKHFSKITVHDYLLAEMFAERSFEITENSKIEIE